MGQFLGLLPGLQLGNNTSIKMKTNLKILWEEIYVPVLWISLGETSQVTRCNPKEETFAFEAH